MGETKENFLHRLLLLFLCLATGIASADTFNWSYSGTVWGGSDTVSASGTFTTDPFNGSYYQITDITGQRNGVAITGLSNFAGSDNQLFLSGPTFDSLGLSYTAGGVDYNIYWTLLDFDELHLEFNPFHQIDFDVASITVSPAAPAVPEPASIILLASGGLALVRKFKRS